MKKIMGHLTGKLSLSILSVIVLLVGVLAGLNGITSMKASGKSATAASRSSQTATQTASQSPAVTTMSAKPAVSKPAVSKVSATTAASKPAANEADAAKAAGQPAVSKEEAAKIVSQSPVAFEPNRGQTDSKVQYMAHSLGYQVFLTGPSSAELQFQPKKNGARPDILSLNFAGSTSKAAGQLLEPTGGVSNYYLGPDRSKWFEGVPNYSKVRYDDVYPGIDVVYQGDHTSLRYDFVVKPGADPKAIQIAYQGDNGISIDKDGNAVVDLSNGHLISSKPVVFQEYGGQKHTVAGSYVLSAAHQLSFEIGPYDKTQNLVIDPSNSYASYVGPDSQSAPKTLVTTLSTQLNGVALDNIGDIFMTGTTLSPAYGATIGQCAIVVKTNLQLTNVSGTKASSVFCGLTSSNNAVGNAIAVEAGSGGAVVVAVGVTNAGTNWPVSHPIAAEPAANEQYHAFVIEMTNGLAVTWNTLLVGAGAEVATGVAVESATGANPGRVHVVGGTSSDVGTNGNSFLKNTGFTGQPYQAVQASSTGGAAGFGSTNAFYVALSSATPPTTAFATYFGGYGTDVGNAVAVDTAGNAYMTGTSNSFGAGTVVGVTGFPTGGPACPVNPTVTFPKPIPPTDFIWTPIQAMGTAIVNGGVVTGLTITNPGAGYSPSQNGAHIIIEGCPAASVSMVVQEITIGPSTITQSANNLPIPTTTLTLTNPGTGYFAGAPPVTISGGGCTVEPTAEASVDTFSPLGALNTLVLTSMGEGCMSGPSAGFVVTIAAPPTVGGVQGIQATATFMWGTNNIAINPNGTTLPNQHAFVAKFNPNAPAAVATTANPNPTTNPATLSYAVVVGGAGPVGIPTVPFFSYTTEFDAGSAIAVDNFGNAYVAGTTVDPSNIGPPAPIPAAAGTFPLVPNPGFTPITTATTGLYGNPNNMIFTSPGTSAGLVTGITLTSAGLGYPASTTIPVTFFFPLDVTGLNPIGACSILPTGHANTDTDGSIDVNGLVLDTPGEGCTTAPNLAFLAPHTVPATAFSTLGTVVVGKCQQAGLEVCGFVVEIVSNQIINGGPITTSTQNGLLLGEPITSTPSTPPNFVAGFPAMVYATAINGDEAFALPFATNTNWGNGLGPVPPGNQTIVGGVICGFLPGGCLDPVGTPSPNGVPMVDGEFLGNAIAVDTLGNAYVSGQTTLSDFMLPGSLAPAADQALMMRRRVNARGFPSNPTTQTSATGVSPTVANTLFLTDFPPQLDLLGDATVTPFGSLPAGAGAFSALTATAFDPATNSNCSVGFVDEGLPSEGHDTAISIFPTGAGTQPQTSLQAYGLTPAPFTGFAVCTQFLSDIIIGPQNLPSQTGVTWTMPAGTTFSLASGAPNSTFQSLSANIVANTNPGGIPPTATVSFGPVTKVYFDGFRVGMPISSSTATPIDWLEVNVIAGTTIGLTLNCAAPGVVGCTDVGPGASFLDPGTYYVALTLIPTVTGGTADNAGIPQTVIITLNVTGVLDVNTALGGGTPAPGTTSSTAAGTNIAVGLTQGTAGTAHWPSNSVLDSAGNLVLNIPVISAVPLNSPSDAAFVFLTDQSVCAQGTVAGSNPLTSCMQPFNPPGATPGSTALSILHTGAASGAPVLIGSTAGSIFLNPAAGVVEQSPGVFTSDLVYLLDAVPGSIPCGAPGSFIPFLTFDPTSKAEGFSTLCYIQVVIPPTILQGAPAGSYTATFQLQAAPDLSNPATPLISNPSDAFVSMLTESFSTVGCAFGALPGPTGNCVPSSPTAVVNITINPQAGPLFINSPWISNTNLPGGCLSGGIGFTTPVCNTNGPVIPLAPFTVPGQVPGAPPCPGGATGTCYAGTVTSAITGVAGGNNVLNNPFNDVVLDARNLGTTTPTTFSATVTGGITNTYLAGAPTAPASAATVFVTPLQTQNDLNVFSNISDRLDDRDIQTCTVASPPIPPTVLTINGSPTSAAVTGVLPAANADVTTTAFTIGINDPAAANMTNGFYASTINVVPVIGGTPSPAQGASIPVCLEVGNNMVVQFAAVPPPTTVPPPFAGSGFPGANVIPGPNCFPFSGPIPPATLNTSICTVSPGLFLESGDVQDVQVLATGLGPNQFAPLSGGASFGTPGYLNVPVDVNAAPTCAAPGPGQLTCNQTWETPLVAPANIGNEFSASALGTITLGTFTAANCSAGPAGIGSPTGPCFSTAYRDEVLAPSGVPAGAYALNFNIDATGFGLLAATGPVDAPSNQFTASLTVNISSGPALLYSAATATAPVPVPPTSPGIVAAFTIINPGLGYLNAPTVTLTNGGCSVEPIASANITNPGPTGFVSTIVLNTLGVGCTSPPTVTITAPETPGGIVATAIALISNGVIPFTFTQPTDTPVASSTPLFTDVTILASAPGISVNAAGPFYLPNTPFAHWLDVAHNNCNPIIFNPDPAHVCQFTFSLDASVATLPTGTYHALVDLISDPFSTEPAVEAVLVTLNITNLPTVLASPAATFSYVIGGATTSPASAATNLSVNFLPTGETGIPFTAVPSSSAGTPANLANWIFISFGGSTPGSGTVAGTLTTSPQALTITVNPAILPLLVAGMPALDGVVTVTTSGSQTSNPTLSIPVTLIVANTPSLSFSSSTGVTCGAPNAGGNVSCTAPSAFTIGQAPPAGGGAAPGTFSTVLTLAGSTPDQLSISSNQPWLIPSLTTSNQSVTPLTLTLDTTKLPSPLAAGPLTAVVTASGKNGPELATFTVNLTVAAPPVINLTALTCLPANPVTAGTASVTCTATAALSVAPANPTTLPASVTASIGSGPCVVTPSPATFTLSTTATPLSFTVAPSTGTGLSASCTLNVGVATTGGITPVISASGTATITVQGATLTANPASQVINLPTLAAPATFTETVQAISPGGNNVAIPFTCNPSVSLPVGGTWLACTNGTTTTAPPFASSIGTVTSSGLAQGQYGGSVAFSTTQPSVTSQPPNVPVTLNIGALAVSGGPVNFQHQFGVTTPATATLMVSAGPAAIMWVAAAPVPSAGTANCNWLIPGAASGTTPGGNGSNSVSVSYNPALLPNQNAATYQCTINYSAAPSYGSAAPAIPVVVTLTTANEPVLTVTPPTAQILSAFVGTTTTSPANATFAITTVTTFSTPPNTVNISVAPTAAGNGFTGNPPGVFTAVLSSATTPASLTITANPSPASGALAPGTYTGQFTVSSPSTPPVNVVVQLVVTYPVCQFTATPSTFNLTNAVPSTGTPVTVPGAFTVSPELGCTSANTWTASSDVSWLIITSGGTGNGGAASSGTFNALSNPKSGQRTGTITITPVAGTPTVIQVTQVGSTAATLLRQVTALYQSVLGRDPDPAGYTFWTGAGSGGLGQMLDSFTTSPEAFNTDFAVMSAWQAATGAPPTFAEYTNTAGNVRAGETIATLFTTLSNNNNPSYSATNLYMNLLNRAPGSGDAACISSGLAACFETIIGYPATTNPVSATNNEFQSTGTFHTDHTNNLYINMLYLTVLGRAADPGGLQFWLGIANSGGAGILFQGSATYGTRIQIVGTGVPGQGFAGSPEFQALFQ